MTGSDQTLTETIAPPMADPQPVPPVGDVPAEYSQPEPPPDMPQMTDETPIPPQNDPVEPEPEPPAVIQSAQYDYDGSTVILMITEPRVPEPHMYALNTTDPYGLSPFLRDELARMVGAGEMTIEPSPPYASQD